MNLEHCLAIVERIIASKSFGRSETYANMLKYLVEGTVEHKSLKETTIANDIFGKENFDPSQSTLVRVYAYHLRKKLAKYYENEGVNDSTIIEIPKGGYEVQFIDKLETDIPLVKNKTPWVIGIGSFLLLAIGLVVFFNFQKEGANTLWEDILSSNKPSMLVIGDLLIYKEIDSVTGRAKTIRDPGINSKEEFYSKKLNGGYESSRVELLSYAYLIKNSANWVKDLSNVLFRYKKDFVIRTMSRFNPKELSDNNLIVIGMLKTLGLFKDYLKKEGYTLKNGITYKDSKTGKIQSYKPSGNASEYHTDYSVIMKVAGPNNNSIYLFGGILDTGASQSLKYFTDVKLANDLELTLKKKFGEIPQSYKVLLEVSGIDRMELNSTIIHLEKIE